MCRISLEFSALTFTFTTMPPPLPWWCDENAAEASCKIELVYNFKFPEMLQFTNYFCHMNSDEFKFVSKRISLSLQNYNWASDVKMSTRRSHSGHRGKDHGPGYHQGNGQGYHHHSHQHHQAHHYHHPEAPSRSRGSKGSNLEQQSRSSNAPSLDRQITIQDVDCLREAFALFDPDKKETITPEKLGKVGNLFPEESWHILCPLKGFEKTWIPANREGASHHDQECW